jgi:aminoglycoside 6'-N-acetyltransferase I
MDIRPLNSHEHEQWLDLRLQLWPELTRAQLERDQLRLLRDASHNSVLVAALPGGRLLGFIEVSIRDWAEGCSTEPVGYIEGWFVEEEYRRSGTGRKLAEAAEAWALAKGCSEMGSDAELWNEVSHIAHQALGYTEATRLVCFSKRLGATKAGA